MFKDNTEEFNHEFEYQCLWSANRNGLCQPQLLSMKINKMQHFVCAFVRVEIGMKTATKEHTHTPGVADIISLSSAFLNFEAIFCGLKHACRLGYTNS